MSKINFRKQLVPFTQVANSTIVDPSLSLKAKGLYTYLQSKPDGWDFNHIRISKESKDGRIAVLNGLNELEDKGYLERYKKPNGRMEYVLKIVQDPNAKAKVAKCDSATVAKSHSVIQRPLSNKDTKVIKNNNKYKNTYGEFQNVKLAEEEIKKLRERLGDDNVKKFIRKLDLYIESTGKKYKSHYATIINWSNNDGEDKRKTIKVIK